MNFISMASSSMKKYKFVKLYKTINRIVFIFAGSEYHKRIIRYLGFKFLQLGCLDIRLILCCRKVFIYLVI